jgi:hypothetical protein
MYKRPFLARKRVVIEKGKYENASLRKIFVNMY